MTYPKYSIIHLALYFTDKKFNDLNKEMVEYTAKLIDAIKKQDFKAIQENYDDVKSICHDCHNVYKDL